MSKRDYDLQLGKDTWKELEKLHSFGYSNSTIFNDFVDICLLSLLSFTKYMQYTEILDRLENNELTGEYEEQYLNMVEKYKENKTREKGTRPADIFANACGLLVKETWEAEQDVLGEIFMAKVSYGEHGQFFTPSNVADMMARMLYSNKKRETVNDPACGSGRFFISM